MTPDRATIKRHLMSWAAGTPPGPVSAAAGGDASATVLVESSEHVAELRATGVIGPQTVVFAPDDRAEGSVVYEGTATEPGQELVIGDFYLQIQDYATSPYMTVLGPTLVRIFGGEDFSALLHDADVAREDGAFADFATAPAVQLADLPALGLRAGSDGPRLRLYVDAEGTMSTSTSGLALGSVGTAPRDLAARWDELNEPSAAPCAVCLGDAIPDADRVDALAARPWLARYLLALDALRDLHARGIGSVHVSGFGGRLDERIAERPAREVPLGPLLLWSEDTAYVRAALAGRTFELPPDVGRLAEALLVCGSVAEAHDLADAGELQRVATMFSKQGVELVAEAVA